MTSLGINDHFKPVEKPAPPLPRNPEAFTNSTISSGVFFSNSRVLDQSPRFRAPARPLSNHPYRFVKILSSSFNIDHLPQIIFILNQLFLKRLKQRHPFP